MELTVNQKIKLRVTRQIMLAGTGLALIYVAFARGFEEVYPFIVGAIVGLLMGAFISLFELWVFTSGIKKLRFSVLLTLRTLLYLVLVTFIIFNTTVVVRMIRFNLSYNEVLASSDPEQGIVYYLTQGDFYTAVIFTLAFAFFINFTRMMSRKIGQGMLLSFISGTYYAPVSQSRIIMFLHIDNSNKISEKLGPYKFHQFLKNFFYDITPPIVQHQGIIYEYIEDLIVISWSMEKGTRDANCIRVFFNIIETLKTLNEKYFEEYGFIPKINAGLHCGSVVRAEIGDIKTQIVFHGDVMNTCARVLDETKNYEGNLLITKDVFETLDLPLLYQAQSIGLLKLRGKQTQTELFAISDKELTRL